MLRTTALLALALCATPALGQEVGTSLPYDFELDEIVGLPTQEFGDLAGRALLIEFFAYW